MKRLLVVTLPERGHYHPLLAPAQELASRGVEVTFACTVDISHELAAAGVERIAIPPGAPPPPALRGVELAAVLADPERLAGWIRTLLVDAPAAGVAPLRAIIRDARPDVVAIDTMAYDAAIAAELERVPWVGWSTSLNPVVPDSFDSELIRTLRRLDRARHSLFADHGLAARFRVSDVLSPRGTAVFATEALVGHAFDPTTRLVGSSLGGARGGERSDGARVYISFGSQAWHQPARFDRLFEAVANLGVDVLAAMGDLATTHRGRVPSNVTCVGYADQLAALRSASVFVTHGGANSVMEACAFGVPMLVAPLCNDQPHNARFVEQAGCGIAVDLERTNHVTLVAALRRLLAEGTHRKASRHLAASYRTSGARGAADLAERACG